jgi:hypothetical protein
MSYTLFDNPLAFHPAKARLALVEKQVRVEGNWVRVCPGGGAPRSLPRQRRAARRRRPAAAL